MIELKNVSKIYKSKKAEDTKALNDISFKLGNKGLTFIVGTSGSGKSTLLNVLGGLDRINSGKILIDGKELSKFNKKELDKYRNNYVGFVFQDYNVIEDYNLEENISLSLDLQGIKNKELVDETINKVGLKGLNKRQINELSGGQKQRVAIARAIVKKPYFLLADEPTGNLDSKTGVQIMDLLKDISKDHLVVVVSHDMNLADKYADRIIEISDGSVIKDTKSKVTDEINEPHFKESKFPFKRIVRLAFSNMKHKLGRIIMTIVLTSLAMFFLAFSFNLVIFNGASLHSKVVKDNNVNRIDITKRDILYDFENFKNEELDLTEEDYNEFNKLLPNNTYLSYNINNNGENLNFDVEPINAKGTEYYTNFTINIIDVKKDSYIGDIIGKMPSKYNEIVIDEYVAEFFTKFGVKLINDEVYKPLSIDQIISDHKQLKLVNIGVYVVGILKDDEHDKELYKKYKNTNKITDYDLLSYLSATNNNNQRSVYSVGLIKKLNIPYSIENKLNDISGDKLYSDENLFIDNQVSYYDANGNVNETNEINANEIIITQRYIEFIYEENGNIFSDDVTNYLMKNQDKTYYEGKQYIIKEYLKKHKNIIGSKINLRNGKWLKLKNKTSVVIKGISLDDNSYFDNNILNNYTEQNKKINRIVCITNDYEKLDSLFKKYPVYSVDFFDTYKGYMIDYKFSIYTGSITSLFTMLHKIILAVTLIFMIFAFLLIYNFVMVTIKFSQKNIGILRALGTKNKDINKIFGVEAFTISFISWSISVLLWINASNSLNVELFEEKFFNFTGIVIEPLTYVFDIGFILFVTFFIMIFSISRISRINPIDTINNKI